MPKRPRAVLPPPRSSAVRQAAAALLDAVAEEIETHPLSAEGYARAISDLERLRGCPLIATGPEVGAGSSG